MDFTEDSTGLLGRLRRLAASDDSEIAQAFRELDGRMQSGSIPFGWQPITQDEYARLMARRDNGGG